MAETTQTQHRRRAGRRTKAPSGPTQPPWRLFRRHFEPTKIVSDDELEAIHEASLDVLRDIGMDFLHPEALRLWKAAGAKITDQRVRLDADLVADLISAAPAEFTLHAPNPRYDLPIGGDHVVFTAVASAPNCSDRHGGRRAGNTDDYVMLLKLTEQLNAVQANGGYPVEPIDVHPSIRHLVAGRLMLTLTGKAVNAYSLGRARNLDTLEMTRIRCGLSHDDLDTHPIVQTVINVSSPLRLDTPMLEGIIQYSARNQVVILTPFTLAGAMAPVTIPGALVQQNAEALAGIAFTQLVRRGSPVVYGGFTSNVDMQSGAPAFGTPEYMKAAMIGGQLARRYGLPYRSSNACAANAVDAQSGYESTFSLWGAVMGGANIVYHGAGWMEGGLHASPEKMVIDADLLAMTAAFLEPTEVNDDTLATDGIAEAGPGGHHFGTAHTQARYRDAFYRPMISDWRNYETWDEAGRPTALDHAERVVGELLAAYEPPAIDDAVRAELDDFVERRIAEGGAETDF